MTRLASPGARFRQAVQDHKPLQVLGAINAYFAKLAEKSGAKALYISGGGVAACSCGIPDLGITTMEDVLTALKRITDATELPVLVDLDADGGLDLVVAASKDAIGRPSPSTWRRYEASWAKNASQQGSDTTRSDVP